MVFICKANGCGRRFQRKFDLRQHIGQRHVGNQTVEKCFLCGQVFYHCDELQEHHAKVHKPSRRFIVKESAYKKNFVTFRYHFLPDERNFDEAQNGLRKKLVNLIANEAAKRIICKISLIFITEMMMVDHQGDRISRCSIPFRAPNFLVNGGFSKSIIKFVRQSFIHQRMAFDEFMKSGSNWQFERALAFDIEISTIKPLRGGRLDISNFKNSTALYSPSNKNNKCFLYCIAYFLLFGLSVKRMLTTTEELAVKKAAKKFDTRGLSFPSSVSDVKRFLDRNPQLDLKINILYKGSEEKIYPLEFGLGSGKKVLNLLLVPGIKCYHFVVIKNIDFYLKKVYNEGTGKKLSYQKAFYCLNCLNNFGTKKKRDQHTESCVMNKARMEVVPKIGENIVKFKNFEHQHEMEYIAFLDFECILPEKTERCLECSSLKCKCDSSFIKDVNIQIPITYSFVVLGPNNKIIHERTKSCPNAHIDFLQHLLEQEEGWISKLLETKHPMILSQKDVSNFKAANNCYLCGIEFDRDHVKCRDHSHISSAYLGAACQQCNLRRRRPRKLKIFVHNCSKYDMHFLIKALSSQKDKITGISILPYNGENFRTLRFNCFEFVDSLSFLQASLAQLSKELQETDHDYPILKQTYLVKTNGKEDSEKLKLVLGKSFFPYEYCTSLEKMMETKKLPLRKNFDSSLSESKISKDDHNFAKSVWNKFQCKNLLDYTEIYCKIDTILLAEIFQAFRKKMIAFSGLDPAYYISLPAYGYDSMLKITGCEIELPTDIDVVHFLERCKRGGVSFINTRYLWTSNTDNRDIVYIDRNNLYGEAQVSMLPYKGFRWLNEDEVNNFDPYSDFDDEDGFILEVDLEYPKELHVSHSNLPLAPEVLEINYDNLSPYAKEALKETEGKRTYKDVKLMSTFHDKTNYVLHCKNLALYLRLGLRLIKIHRILGFKQDMIFKPYIAKTTRARKNSRTKFEMDMFKKLVSRNDRKLKTSKKGFLPKNKKVQKSFFIFQSNSVYGKTMQNVREYMEVKLHTSVESALKACSNPTFKHYSIIDENLVQTNHFPETIKHNTPIAIGVTILELVSIILV
jgi:hypothetical protein